MSDILKVRKSRPRTLDKVIMDIYYNQITNSKKRNHKPPTYSLKELKEWMLKQSNFDYIYKNWLKSGRISDLIPSVDRLNDDKGYSIKNIQLMTWRENNQKSHESNREVCQFNKKGKLVKKYPNIKNASEVLKLDAKMIYTCVSGESLSGHGFLWIYKDELKNTFKKRMEQFISNSTIGKHRNILMYNISGKLIKSYPDSLAVINEHGMGRDTLSRSINKGIIYKKKFFFILDNEDKEVILKERLRNIRLSQVGIVFRYKNKKDFIFNNIIHAISYLKRYLDIAICKEDILKILKDENDLTWRTL